MQTVTRFAPSPTGRLHLGHAYSALFAADRAARAGGRFLLRIEDIDRSRCWPEFEAGILEDLAWLGLAWEKPVRRQSDRMADYAAALAAARFARGLLYPCFCTRREIEAAATAPHGPEGAPYAGTCRSLTPAEREARMARGDAYALRLTEGDTVVARKDIRTSYHLAVVVDDALQGVTLVTRGEDLAFAVPIQNRLQRLLGMPVPDYEHHPLLTDAEGRRLAKRDRALTLQSLREAGVSPDEVRARIERVGGTF